MQTYTLSMPDCEDLLSPYEAPKGARARQNRLGSTTEAVLALPITSEAVRPVPVPIRMPVQSGESQTKHETGTGRLSLLRARLQSFLKAGVETRISHIDPLRQAVQDLARKVESAGTFPVGRVVTAVESLIREMGSSRGNISDTAARTLAHACDFLTKLVAHAGKLDRQMAENVNVLAVDDEAIPRRAIENALGGAGIGCLSVGDPAQALPILEKNQFDLVIIDIRMPGMDGYAFCRRLRGVPGYAKVPVFFVTAMNDFQCRVESLYSGGDDFIPKPFISHELAVKAMVTVFEKRLFKKSN